MNQWLLWIAKKKGILACLLGICLLVGALLVFSAFSSKTPERIGKWIPAYAVLSERQQLFSRPNGGFLLVSQEGDQCCVSLFHQDGTLAKTDSADSVKCWTHSSANAWRKENLLYLAGSHLSGSMEEIGALFTYPLEEDKLNRLDECSHLFSNEYFGLDIATMTVGEDGRFYALQEGMVLSFFADEISDEFGPEALEHWYWNEQFPEVDQKHLAISPDGILYALGERDGSAVLTVLDCKQPYDPDAAYCLEQGDIPIFPLRFLDETLAVDDKGTLYRIRSDQSFQKQLDTLSPDAVSMLGNGNWLVKSSQNLLQEYAPTDFSSPVASYLLDGEICALSDGQEIMVLLHTDQGYSLLPFSEAADRPVELPSSSETSHEGDVSSGGSEGEHGSSTGEGSSEILSEPAIDTDSSKGSSDSASSNWVPEKIVSTQFAIDEKRNIITVPAGTTVAGLKKTLQLGNAELRIQKGTGAAVTSGKLATGLTLHLWYEGKELDTVTVVVPGDLTGTGTVNSRDVQLLYQYLLGKEEEKALFFFAADLNGDQEVDNRDLVLIKKYILEN